MQPSPVPAQQSESLVQFEPAVPHSALHMPLMQRSGAQ